MRKRMHITFVVMLLLTSVVMVRLLTLSLDVQYTAAAHSQSTYRLELSRTRGRIYDAQLRPLAGGRVRYKAAIAPSEECRSHLAGVMEPKQYAAISENLRRRSPFVCVVSSGDIEGSGVSVFRTETRYSANTVAEHTIGYLNGSGEGASGIERVYDSYLAGAEGALTLSYEITAAGGSLAGVKPTVTDTTANSRAGVVLTLDTDIQLLAEEAAKQLPRGAVVVMELPDCKLRAVVSTPSIECDSIGTYLEREDAPLLNRAISAYDIGSVFKLTVAAAALETGLDPTSVYCCEGYTDIGENRFHCSNREGHGDVDMYSAIACSCNTYFIDLARQIGGERILEYARRLGLGQSISLCDGYDTAAGCLPEPKTLDRPAALANLAFGQGELLSTPMHMAALTAAIANGGIYRKPSILVGLVNAEGEYIQKTETPQGKEILSQETCRVLTLAMRKAVTEGTASGGEGERVQCAAKTGTAQTGIVENGHKVLQAWYAGFFPYDDPRYVCVVLAEDGKSGGSSAAPVFKHIADGLERRCQ
ncbi:MAG: penicillin-binding protein 2 [Ruminococcaceae bacterium]|nr:penicillin-binding protein 2 [Oscillospiraceae bacterium]